MKHILTLILILIAESLSAQIQHPTLISMLGIGGEAGDYLYSRPIKTYDGGFIIPIQTRSSTGNLNTGCTSTDFRYLFNKYNSDGTILEWQKCIPYNNDSGFRYMFSNSNDTFTIGGALYSSSTAQDFLLQKRDNVGSIVWTKVYGGVASELLRDMTQTPDGGYVMLGISNSNDGDVGFHYGGQLITNDQMNFYLSYIPGYIANNLFGKDFYDFSINHMAALNGADAPGLQYDNPYSSPAFKSMHWYYITSGDYLGPNPGSVLALFNL